MLSLFIRQWLVRIFRRRLSVRSKVATRIAIRRLGDIGLATIIVPGRIDSLFLRDHRSYRAKDRGVEPYVSNRIVHLCYKSAARVFFDHMSPYQYASTKRKKQETTLRDNPATSLSRNTDAGISIGRLGGHLDAIVKKPVLRAFNNQGWRNNPFGDSSGSIISSTRLGKYPSR